MEEPITFWLDNKTCSGFKRAEIGPQSLVSYRDKFYIVVAGAALMKGSKPLHYSKTSMPALWKKALKGAMPTLAVPAASLDTDEILPVPTSAIKERTMTTRTMDDTPAPPAEQALKPATNGNNTKKYVPPRTTADQKPVKIIPGAVVATCPYCSHKQDLPFEKGKNGKPFFATCAKCSADFAVRFVPVTMYQAQVAAFK